jgi:hypothetical protein
VHQFEFCSAATKKAARPKRRAAFTKATATHCGFVAASPSHDLRDGEGDFARKLRQYPKLSLSVSVIGNKSESLRSDIQNHEERETKLKIRVADESILIDA